MLAWLRIDEDYRGGGRETVFVKNELCHSWRIGQTASPYQSACLCVSSPASLAAGCRQGQTFKVLVLPFICFKLPELWTHPVPSPWSSSAPRGYIGDMLASIWYAKKMGRRLMRSFRRSRRLQLQFLVGRQYRI